MTDHGARPAPALPAGIAWLDTPPLSLDRDLRGHVVLLFFWTMHNVHCRHVLQSLEYLAQRFASRPFQIVAIHCGELAEERGPDAVRAAVARLGVVHPVAIDDEFAAWRAFGVRAWPTLCLIDGSGAIRFEGAGEPDRARLGHAVEALVEEAELAHPAPRRRALLTFAPGRLPATALKAPAGLALDPGGGCLWIADSGRHRVVAVELATGALRAVVGCGHPGGADGDFSFASLHAPRGLCADAGGVWIADSGNHLLRRADTALHELRTVAGQRRRVRDPVGGLCGDAQGLASPWCVAGGGDRLWLAMAGMHQLWEVDVASACASAFAGTGVAGRIDGTRQDCAFAQPVGVAVHGRSLAVVDAATGALRLLDLDSEFTTTLIGAGPAPAAHRDGAVEHARLWRPSAVAWSDDGRHLLVADALAGAVRRVDVAQRTAETLLTRDDGLVAPEALALAGDTLFVADAGSDRVLRCDLRTRAVAPLVLVDPHPDHEEPPADRLVLRARAQVTLCFPLTPPAGALPVPDVQPVAYLRNGDGAVLLDEMPRAVRCEGEWGVVERVPTGDAGEGELELLVRALTCDDLDGVVHRQDRHGRFRVELTMDGPDVADLQL